MASRLRYGTHVYVQGQDNISAEHCDEQYVELLAHAARVASYATLLAELASDADAHVAAGGTAVETCGRGSPYRAVAGSYQRHARIGGDSAHLATR
jgi:hypothetical protein